MKIYITLAKKVFKVMFSLTFVCLCVSRIMQ